MSETKVRCRGDGAWGAGGRGSTDTDKPPPPPGTPPKNKDMAEEGGGKARYGGQMEEGEGAQGEQEIQAQVGAIQSNPKQTRTSDHTFAV